MSKPRYIHRAHATPVEDRPETVVEGRSEATPFLLLGGVAAIVWSAVAVLTVVCLLVWWFV